jgi:type VI secretion system ImpM family protein
MRLGVGYYGKLPIAEEYLEFLDTPASDAVAMFRKWFDSSIARLGLSFADREAQKVFYETAGPALFVLRTPDPLKAIVGVAIPSHDRTGRHFPFVVYAETDLTVFQMRQHLIPEAFAQFLRTALLSMADASESFCDTMHLKTILALRQGIPIDAARAFGDYRGVTSSLTIAEFLHPGPDEQECRTAFRAALRRFAFSTAQIPDRDKLSEFDAIFRFPLSRNRERQGLEVAFWLELTERTIRRALEKASFLWTRDHLSMCFGDPSDIMLPIGWNSASLHDLLWDFSTMDIESVGIDASLTNEIDRILANQGLRTQELITSVAEAIRSFPGKDGT